MRSAGRKHCIEYTSYTISSSSGALRGGSSTTGCSTVQDYPHPYMCVSRKSNIFTCVPNIHTSTVHDATHIVGMQFLYIYCLIYRLAQLQLQNNGVTCMVVNGRSHISTPHA